MDEIVTKVFKDSHTIAVVGLSNDPGRPSYHVAEYLMGQGYNVIPVNPRQNNILEKKCYPDLSSIPEKVDIVDVFRRTEDVMPIAEEAIKIGARVLWMQEGIVNEEAAELARQAGLTVIMNRCMFKEHSRLGMRHW